MSVTEQERISGPFSLVSREAYADRLRYWNEMRHERPVYFDADTKMWVVTRYDDVRNLLQSPTLFGKPPTMAPLTDLLPEVREVVADFIAEFVPTFESNPPEHSFFKRIVRAPLAAPKIGPRRPIIEEIANDLVDEFIDESEVDLIDRYAFLLPAIHTYRYLGVGEDELQVIRQEGISQTTLWQGFPPPEAQMELAVQAASYWERLKALVDDHIANPRDDIVTDLITARSEEDGRTMTRIEVASILRGLVVGAHRTSTNLIGNVMYALLSVPERWERVVADPRLAEGAVNESLRCDAPAVGHFYVALQDVEMCGELIKAGDRVYPCYFSANHDESQYDDPDVWDMDREDNTRNFAFGGGIHLCPGTVLGRLTGTTAVTTLAERIPTMRLSDQTLERLPTFMSNGFEQLLVTLR